MISYEIGTRSDFLLVSTFQNMLKYLVLLAKFATEQVLSLEFVATVCFDIQRLTWRSYSSMDCYTAIRISYRKHYIYEAMSWFPILCFDASLRRNFSISSLQERIKILDTDRNWNELLYKKALNIERKDPSLNKGLKASRQLKLFR